MRIIIDETLIIDEKSGIVITDLRDSDPQLLILIIKQLIEDRNELEKKYKNCTEIIQDKNKYIEYLEG